MTTLAKIEKLLGLDSSIRPLSYISTATTLWPNDKYLIPFRHHQSRTISEIESSEEFIKKHMKLGANKILYNTFLTFQIIAAVLIIGGIAIFLYYCYW